MCIWTLREKKWPILNFLLLFYFFDRPHQYPLFPHPSLPHCGSVSTVKDAIRAPEWWWRWAGRGGGAFSHPRVKYQLWLCEHTNCAYLLAYARAHTTGLTRTIENEKTKKTTTHECTVRVHTGGVCVCVWASRKQTVYTRINMVHCWKRKPGAADLRLPGCEELFCGAACSFRLGASPDFTCCGQLY